MAELNKKDFTKPCSKGPYAGKSRLEACKLKIKDKKPFIVGKNASGRKVYATAITPTWPHTLNAGKERISITKIFKDPDFGGGGGSRGGAELTKLTESGQCYYCSLAFNVMKKKISKKDATTKNMMKASQWVKATKSFKEFDKEGPNDWIEEDVYIKIANELFTKYNTNVAKKPVYFHRGSKFMQAVYDAKKRVMLEDKKSQTPQAPGTFSDDKWNPGDIWMTTMLPSEDPIKQIKRDWQILNREVLIQAGKVKQSRTFLLGISLKKTGSPRITEFNLPKRVHNKEVPFKKYSFGHNNDFFSSIDMYFYMGEGKIQFRNTNVTAMWQGEISGATAAGGKIGGGNVNYYCEKHFKKSIGYNKVEPNWKEFPLNKVDLKNMFQLYKKYDLGDVRSKVKSEQDFIKKSKAKGPGFMSSKNMCLKFLDTFKSGTKRKQDEFCTDMIRYAASNTDVSSFFIKVS